MPIRPFIPAPNTVSVEFMFILANSSLAENVIHIEKGAPYTLAQIQTLRTNIGSYWDSNLKNMYLDNIQFNRIRIKALDTNIAPMEDYTWSPVKIGGRSAGGAALPNSICCALKLSTGLAGRSNRGRIYIPVTESGALQASFQNELDPTYASAIITIFTAFMAQITTWDATAHMVVTSFMTGGAWRATAVNHQVIACTFVDRHIDSQRRRLTGRGI